MLKMKAKTIQKMRWLKRNLVAKASCKRINIQMKKICFGNLKMIKINNFWINHQKNKILIKIMAHVKKVWSKKQNKKRKEGKSNLRILLTLKTDVLKKIGNQLKSPDWEKRITWII